MQHEFSSEHLLSSTSHVCMGQGAQQDDWCQISHSFIFKLEVNHYLTPSFGQDFALHFQLDFSRAPRAPPQNLLS
ncbi:hypothetical protein ACUR5C_09475 [Aliikangiella sp. IMCC44653]